MTGLLRRASLRFYLPHPWQLGLAIAGIDRANASLLLLSKLEIEALRAACHERRQGGRPAERVEALLRTEA